MSAPWDPELIYEFFYLENEMREAHPLALQEELQMILQRHLSLLIHLCEYCGFQNTWARLAEKWHSEGIPMNRAWMGAALGGQLALAGLHDLSSQLFHTKQIDSLSLTPLHFWALAESCEWLQEDFIPQCIESGGLHFGDLDQIQNDLKSIGDRFSPIREVLEGDLDPYSRLRLVHQNATAS